MPRKRCTVKGKKKMTAIERELDALLQQAMSQPGISEVVEVYEAAKTALETNAAAEQMLQQRWVASVSDSSATPRY